MEKYFDNDEEMLDKVFKRDSIVLDAGCGAGMAAIDLLGDKLKELQYIGVDISNAVDEAQNNFRLKGYDKNAEFILNIFKNLNFGY